MALFYDVIICGAGPAGCTCAFALERSGLRIVVIEKGTGEEDKVCGGALAAYVPKVLNTINSDFAKAYCDISLKSSVNTIRIVSPSGKSVAFSFRESGQLMKRSDFGSFMTGIVKKLPSAELITNKRIADVRVLKNGVVADTGDGTELRSNLIIGCDGANSLVARKLSDNKSDKGHTSVAVRAYFKNVKGTDNGTFELHYIKKAIPGYLWIFPLHGNIFNVGIGMPSDVIAKENINLKTELQIAVSNIPYLSDRFSNAEMISEIAGSIIPLGSRKVSVSGERFMLCGDAASLADPLTGEGIGQAMVSGRYAGWQVLKCYKENDFSAQFMKQYDTILYNKLWAENRKRNVVRKIIGKREWVLNSAVSLASGSRLAHNIIRKIMWNG